MPGYVILRNVGFRLLRKPSNQGSMQLLRMSLDLAAVARPGLRRDSGFQ
jgi:hypothetical protein